MQRHHLAVLVLASACAAGSPDAPISSTSEEVRLTPALVAGDFTRPLDKAAIRAPQTWLDDAAFETKWGSMIAAPIDLLGGADSGYFADLANLPRKRLPGREVLCHGDPKFDNFGWTEVEGTAVFSDNDFDDADFCPVAADILHYLVATELTFADPALDEAALQTYVATVVDSHAAVAIDPATTPDWASVHTKGLAKDTLGGKLALGGEVQPATAAEVAAVTALVATEWRLPPTLLDVARDVRIDGGSAGWRRFWLLAEDADGVRTIIELKESGIPGPQFGRQHDTLDGDARMEVLKLSWWDAFDDFDHYEVELLGSRFLVRDRLTRTNPKPNKLTAPQIENMVRAEASLLALQHRGGWGQIHAAELTTWLRASARTVTSRWRATYTAAGGH